MHSSDLTLSHPNKFFTYFIISLCIIFYFPRVSAKAPTDQVYGPANLNILLQISYFIVECWPTKEAQLLVSTLGSIGVALRPPHLHLTHFDASIHHFFFSFLHHWFAPIWSDSGRNRPKTTEIERNPPKLAKKLAETAPIRSNFDRIRRGRRKICYQKSCSKKKIKKKWRRRCGDVRCVDFQIEPWNVILIKQCTWAVVGLGNGASWKLPCL